MRWFLNTALLILLIPTAVNASGMWGSPKAYSGGGESLLYSAATAIYDFEGDGVDTKGTHNLTNNNSVTFGSTTPPQGGQYAIFANTASQHFSIVSHDDFNFGNGDYTISFWYYRINTAPVCSKNVSSENGYRIYDYYISDGYHQSITHWEAWGASSEATVWTSSPSTWQHMVLAYTYSTNTVKMWASTTGGFNSTSEDLTMTEPPAANAADFYVGRSDLAYMDGYVDELIIWKGKALDATEAEAVWGGSWR